MVKAALTRETQSTTGVITGMKSNYILHLGAGIGSELSGYLQRDVQGVFLYEPAAPSYQELEKKAQQYKQVHVVQKAVTLAESQGQFHLTRPAQFSSLLDTSGFAKQFKNLAVLASDEVCEFTLQELLHAHPELTEQPCSVDLVLQLNGLELDLLAEQTFDTLRYFASIELQVPRYLLASQEQRETHRCRGY